MPLLKDLQSHTTLWIKFKILTHLFLSFLMSQVLPPPLPHPNSLIQL